MLFGLIACKIYENVRKIPENLGKLLENMNKNGAQRCLILNIWYSLWAESHEGKYSHKILPEKFSGMFKEIRAKLFRTPKNLPAPAPMVCAVGNLGSLWKLLDRVRRHSYCCLNYKILLFSFINAVGIWKYCYVQTFHSYLSIYDLMVISSSKKENVKLFNCGGFSALL